MTTILKALSRVFKGSGKWIGSVLSFPFKVFWKGYSSRFTGFKDKRVWDWMQLFIVPIVLSLGVLFIQNANARVERESTLDNQRQDALITYLDKMESLLLEHDLRQSTEGSEVNAAARARTLSVLRTLDGQRKGYVLQFLEESGLINIDNTVISLDGADFKDVSLANIFFDNVDLAGTNFQGAYLEGIWLRNAKLSWINFGEANLEGAQVYDAYLIEANLEGANLVWTAFTRADLRSAKLSGANLNYAFLYEADLSYADLSYAFLNGAELEGANLENANLEGAEGLKIEQLEKVKSLDNAIMPDGTKYEDWLAIGKPDWNQP